MPMSASMAAQFCAVPRYSSPNASSANTTVSASVDPIDSCATVLMSVFWRSAGLRRITCQPDRSSPTNASTALPRRGAAARATGGTTRELMSTALNR